MNQNSRLSPGATVSASLDSSSFPSPELQAILQSADRRLRSWRPPPNWSAADWSAECRQIEDIAAYKVTGFLDASGNASPARSIYNHLIASVRTSYRREWAYSLHFEARPMDFSPREGEFEELTGTPADESRTYAFLYDAMDELTPDQRFVVEQLFFFGRTETEVGEVFGISQRAVSKRKQRALDDLSASLRRIMSKVPMNRDRIRVKRLVVTAPSPPPPLRFLRDSREGESAARPAQSASNRLQKASKESLCRF